MITQNTEAGFVEDAPERVTFFSFQDNRRYKAGYLRLIRLSRQSLNFCTSSTRHPSRSEHRGQILVKCVAYDYVIRGVFSHVRRSIYINKRLFGIAQNLSMPVRVDEQVDASACASCLGQMHWHFSGPGLEGPPFSPDRCEPTSIAIVSQKGLIDKGKKTHNPVLRCERFIYMLVSITVRPGNTQLT